MPDTCIKRFYVNVFKDQIFINTLINLNYIYRIIDFDPKFYSATLSLLDMPYLSNTYIVCLGVVGWCDGAG